MGPQKRDSTGADKLEASPSAADTVHESPAADTMVQPDSPAVGSNAVSTPTKPQSTTPTKLPQTKEALEAYMAEKEKELQQLRIKQKEKELQQLQEREKELREEKDGKDGTEGKDGKSKKGKGKGKGK